MPPHPAPPRLIPVLDVMNGRVVRAVAGRRDSYRPLHCPLTGSPAPGTIARTLLKLAGAAEVYVADLDAITGRATPAPVVTDLVRELDAPTWLDAGIGNTAFRDFPWESHLRPVVGAETCPGPKVLRDVLNDPLRRRIGFSLDLHGDRLSGNWRAWGLKNDRAALALAVRVIEAGVGTLIVLDVTRVGTGTGAGTEPLVRAIRDKFPDVDLIAGGGVRTYSDVERLGEAGASGVLVASGLHDGSLTVPRPDS
jgi:phosphoribosylformimino-5-aminoimidazole carboxamide ribotide isomerase